MPMALAKFKLFGHCRLWPHKSLFGFALGFFVGVCLAHRIVQRAFTKRGKISLVQRFVLLRRPFYGLSICFLHFTDFESFSLHEL